MSYELQVCKGEGGERELAYHLISCEITEIYEGFDCRSVLTGPVIRVANIIHIANNEFEAYIYRIETQK